MEHSDHQRVKYFCEALDFKYHLGYPWGVPRPPLPLTPLHPYRGVWGGLNGGVDLLVLTPKCDIFWESPCQGLSHGVDSRQ